MTGNTREPTRQRRRYVVHLMCATDSEWDSRRYVLRIRPWAPGSIQAEMRERTFADECELIATINPLLPSGSDVRDVFGHIEGPNGFYYLLNLSNEEAGQLGWRFQRSDSSSRGSSRKVDVKRTV